MNETPENRYAHTSITPDSHRLARVRRALGVAADVLGDPAKAERWLTSKSRALGGQVPLETLDTETGIQQVMQELRQIEFGFPS